MSEGKKKWINIKIKKELYIKNVKRQLDSFLSHDICDIICNYINIEEKNNLNNFNNYIQYYPFNE